MTHPTPANADTSARCDRSREDIDMTPPDSSRLSEEEVGLSRSQPCGAGLQADTVIPEAERSGAYVPGLGCDANGGGPHNVIAQGKYQFCADCGETIREAAMRERARRAEAKAADLLEALKAIVKPNGYDLEGRDGMNLERARAALSKAGGGQ